jgi:hypothetical protein
MKRILPIVIAMLALPVYAAAESWNNVPIVDTQCSAKVKANPDAHARSCALMCAKSGFGIVDKNGNYLKFDDKGNQQALKLLQNSTEKDHLRVNVSGTQDGETIHVQSVKLM